MNIDGVVTGFEFTSDIAILVARGLGLPTHELDNINSLRNKFEMYIEFNDSDTPCAKTEIVSSWDECLEKHSTFAFPFIVTPVSNAGSCGVKLVNNLLELEDAFKNIQLLGEEFSHGIPLSSDVLLQEYLIGDEYSVECAMGGGNFFVLGITDKFTTDNNFFAETSHIFPSSLNTEKKEQISKCVLKLLKSFKMKIAFIRSIEIQQSLPSLSRIQKLMPHHTGKLFYTDSICENTWFSGDSHKIDENLTCDEIVSVLLEWNPDVVISISLPDNNSMRDALIKEKLRDKNIPMIMHPISIKLRKVSWYNEEKYY